MTTRHLARNMRALDGIHPPEKLIDKAGIGGRTLYKLRSGPLDKGWPNLETLEKIADAVGIWPSILLWTESDADREAQLALGSSSYEKHGIFSSGEPMKAVGKQALPLMDLYSRPKTAQATGLITAFATESIEAGKAVALHVLDQHLNGHISRARNQTHSST